MARAAEQKRRETAFGRFVVAYGVPRLASHLGVTTFAVYKWLAGSSSPSHAHRMALVKLSEGQLRLEQIDLHRELLTT